MRSAQCALLTRLAEVTCKTFTELTRQEQNIITAWLQGYHLPEHERLL